MGDVAPRLAVSVLTYPTDLSSSNPVRPAKPFAQPTAQGHSPIRFRRGSILVSTRGSDRKDIRRGATDLRGRRRSATRGQRTHLPDRSLLLKPHSPSQTIRPANRTRPHSNNTSVGAEYLAALAILYRKDIRRGATVLRGRRRSATRGQRTHLPDRSLLLKPRSPSQPVRPANGSRPGCVPTTLPSGLNTWLH